MRSGAILKRSGLAALACAVAAPALAHTGLHEGSGFAAGLTHPMLGVDHLAAMLAVGLWAFLLGGRGRLALPLAFPAVMALGAGLGLAGIGLPAVEAGISASVLVLGLAAALALRLPVAVAAGIVGIFALFHGFAHGAEMPAAAHPVGYAAGFVIATGALHLAGMGLGWTLQGRAGRIATRVAGGLVALTGLGLLTGAA